MIREIINHVLRAIGLSRVATITPATSRGGRPRKYHQDRPATDAEYARASRARRSARQETRQETSSQRQETRQETSSQRQETRQETSPLKEEEKKERSGSPITSITASRPIFAVTTMTPIGVDDAGLSSAIRNCDSICTVRSSTLSEWSSEKRNAADGADETGALRTPQTNSSPTQDSERAWSLPQCAMSRRRLPPPRPLSRLGHPTQNWMPNSKGMD